MSAAGCTAMIVAMLIASLCAHASRRMSAASVACPLVMVLGMVDLCFTHLLPPLLIGTLVVLTAIVECASDHGGRAALRCYRFLSATLMALLMLWMHGQHGEARAPMNMPMDMSQPMAMHEHQGMAHGTYGVAEPVPLSASPVPAIALVCLMLLHGLALSAFALRRRGQQNGCTYSRLSALEPSFIGLSLCLMLV